MPKTLQAHRIISGFPDGFSKILDSWFTVIHEYAAKSAGDAIYWHSERANVGAFASALSRNKYSVLQEFGCEKRRGADHWLGRADISFHRRGVWYLAEVKNKWKLLSDRTMTINTKNSLKESCRDVKDICNGLDSYVPFGMTFVVPWIRPKDGDNVQTYVEALITGIEEDTYCDFWAYCAPGRFRALQSTVGNKNYHPIVVVLGKRITKIQ